jgi:hypothetical protein
LPESSDLILQALDEYLDRVIRDCQSRGDSREQDICRLKDMLGKGIPIAVRTASALRSGTEVVEELPLIDQPRVVGSHLAPRDGDDNDSREQTPRPFQGVLRLDAENVKALGRCILVLDSVIRHQDHSSATFHSWRNKSPLKRFLKSTNQSPILRKLLFETKSGMTLNFDDLLVELVSRWENFDVRSLVSNYFPAASRIKKHDVMNVVFEEARKYVATIGASLSKTHVAGDAAP